MSPPYQVHHKGNENQDLLYQVSNGNCEQIEHPSVVSIQSHEL
uniref:NADH-plastoquinone oxidoreductase subunit K n=1 Tax=Dendrobium pseudotenellum TaxID=1354200 RepID=A0A6B9XR79_9ASPA|nr:NADH-plastoquinone oxidoreductase subunit K [Dendrobium pseudotenellum]QHR85733.1 NADH-plastoquinone oxidoreductase subunit K [Dendrobium pseudotenellum]